MESNIKKTRRSKGKKDGKKYQDHNTTYGKGGEGGGNPGLVKDRKRIARFIIDWKKK